MARSPARHCMSTRAGCSARFAGPGRASTPCGGVRCSAVSPSTPPLPDRGPLLTSCSRQFAKRERGQTSPVGTRAIARTSPRIARWGQAAAPNRRPLLPRASAYRNDLVNELLRSGRSRTATRGQQATFTDASPVFELNVWNREANQAPPDHFETFENKKCILETGHPLDHGTRADPSGVADE